MDLRRGISAAVDKVVETLKSRAQMISTTEEIAQVSSSKPRHLCLIASPSDKVATISANGEREIGDLIARAMEKVGKEGVITVAVR